MMVVVIVVLQVMFVPRVNGEHVSQLEVVSQALKCSREFTTSRVVLKAVAEFPKLTVSSPAYCYTTGVCTDSQSFGM